MEKEVVEESDLVIACFVVIESVKKAKNKVV